MNEVDHVLDRIGRLEPSVHAFVDFEREGAMRRSKVAASCRGGSPPLAGWTLAVKDVIDVAGLPTRCNSPLTSDAPAISDAPVVARLKEAGAFVMAKSVTASFAFLDPGPTRNPWRLDHTPGGSSSGSAAAVAAGFVRLALGTQTGGSINRPASFCGIVGFKPTFGTLPTHGVFPLAPSLDTVGFFTPCVRDAQTALAALQGEPIVQGSCEPLQIALIEDLGCERAEPVMMVAVRRAADLLRQAGHHLETIALPASATEAHACHSELMSAEAARTHHELYGLHHDRYPPMLAAFIQRGRGVSAARLDDVRAQRDRAVTDLIHRLGGFDVALMASAPGPAPQGLASTGDHRMNRLWTYAGFPAVTLPAALDPQGLPLGIQLVAAPWSDHQLLAAALRVEKVLAFAHVPGFLSGGEARPASV